MRIDDLTEMAAQSILNKVCDGLKNRSNGNHSAKEILAELEALFLDPLDNEDFFGTEGWQHHFDVVD
jgi:hypothetical protein